MYYFASDMHLGSGTAAESRARELALVEWLDRVAPTTDGIYLVGDVFDFWYEYKRVVPKGFTRLLGKLAELSDRGIDICLMAGNHDMWQRDYLQKECGIRVRLAPEEAVLYGKRVHIEHGDEIYARKLGGATRLMNTIFRSKTARWLFSNFVHPDLALKFGQGWSHDSRKAKDVALPFEGLNDPMVAWARQRAEGGDIDYFVFGHNHCAEELILPEGPKVVCLGNWFSNPVFAQLAPDGTLTLEKV